MIIYNITSILAELMCCFFFGHWGVFRSFLSNSLNCLFSGVSIAIPFQSDLLCIFLRCRIPLPLPSINTSGQGFKKDPINTTASRKAPFLLSVLLTLLDKVLNMTCETCLLVDYWDNEKIPIY